MGTLGYRTAVSILISLMKREEKSQPSGAAAPDVFDSSSRFVSYVNFCQQTPIQQSPGDGNISGAIASVVPLLPPYNPPYQQYSPPFEIFMPLQPIASPRFCFAPPPHKGTLPKRTPWIGSV
jgi:hypothetical protein